jgi:hypothetical protein
MPWPLSAAWPNANGRSADWGGVSPCVPQRASRRLYSGGGLIRLHTYALSARAQSQGSRLPSSANATICFAMTSVAISRSPLRSDLTRFFERGTHRPSVIEKAIPIGLPSVSGGSGLSATGAWGRAIADGDASLRLSRHDVSPPRLAFADPRIAVTAWIVTPREIGRYVNQCVEPTTTTTSVGSGS